MTSYTRGRDFEYRIVNGFRAKGIYATRTAGSHGIFDVIAIDIKKKKIYLKQAKKDYVMPKDRRRILKAIRQFNGTYIVEANLEVKYKGKREVIR